MTLADLRADELEDLSIDLVLRQVDRLDAVLLAEEVGDLLVGNRAETGQGIAETDVVVLLLLLRLAKLL